MFGGTQYQTGYQRAVRGSHRRLHHPITSLDRVTDPLFGVPAGPVRAPSSVNAPQIGGPCAPARADVDLRCAEAERLAAAAQAHQQTLRDTRRTHAEASRQRDADAHLRDRRRLAEEKAEAKSDYHAALMHASDQGAINDAAAQWLRRIDELNRGVRQADRRADALAQQVNELERSMPSLELAADAARISAEAAQVACLEARRILAACEEQSATGATAVAPVQSQPADVDRVGIANAAAALMGGDRQTLLGLAMRLAEETGFEAGRLQLLLIELREQIYSLALLEHELLFPSNHPFWSQFPPEGPRAVAASLASMGFRFDGTDGWADGRIPQVRDLANALSYCGFDPRSVRRPAGQAAIDGLWQGARVRSEDFLLAKAPELTLSQIVTLLGPRSDRLAELWDIWGRLRPLLMRAGNELTQQR